MKISVKRGIVAGAVVASVLIGLIFHTGTGTLSAIGYQDIILICPIGQLETMAASHGFALRPILLLAGVVLVALFVGKAFCSWLCPVSYIRNFFSYRARGKGADGGAVSVPTADSDGSVGARAASAPAKALPPVGGARDGLHVDTRHFVLGGALISSFAFGFPVFCLVCPIGLTFALLIGVWNLLRFNAASWGLLIVPILILLELVVFRKWCTKICPIGALLSLIASKNATFKPHVDPQVCLRTKGDDCKMCVNSCPEDVDPHLKNIPECSKCGLCADRCPVGAITFPLRPPIAKGESADDGSETISNGRTETTKRKGNTHANE